jgi:fumarylacetoacetase
MPSRAKELKAADPRRPEILWPVLKVISCWGDGPAELACAELQRRFPRTLVQPKGLLATEAFVTIPFSKNFVLDLTQLEAAGFFAPASPVFDQGCLNPLMASSSQIWSQTRKQITSLLSSSNPLLRDNAELRKQVFFPHSEVNMLIPVKIGDYTDFYSSREHAVNVGTMFRDKNNPLLPNWLHIPVGYHGRASSVVVSGTPIRRPHGQILPNPPEPQPIFAPSRRLDFEVELAGFMGHGNPLGTPLGIDSAQAAVFGMVLLNDWSARDIQQWEYVPLGPFLSKSFATTISPWVVTMEALAPFMVDGPAQDPEPLSYLKPKTAGKSHFNIELTVKIISKQKLDPAIICKTNAKHLYWSLAQQIAHHTVAGCNLQCGDLLASGTISGPTPTSYGSMLELSWGGKNPVPINNQETRSFIEDGDTVILEGYCQAPEYRIGFGSAEGVIVAAS